MKSNQNLSNRVLHFVKGKDLFSTNAPLVIGVSGGPDSICMLYILQKIRETLGIKLHIAHLNHLLRGAESEEDAEFVSRIATELGIATKLATRERENDVLLALEGYKLQWKRHN